MPNTPTTMPRAEAALPALPAPSSKPAAVPATTPAPEPKSTKANTYTVKDGVVESGVPATTEEKPFDPAAWMHQRLVNQIVAFEKNLGPDHEIGGRFVEGPGSEPLHISNVASWGPDMILFMGQFADGRKFELIQHYSQVSVLLVAVPKTAEQPRRIGFELLLA